MYLDGGHTQSLCRIDPRWSSLVEVEATAEATAVADVGRHPSRSTLALFTARVLREGRSLVSSALVVADSSPDCFPLDPSTHECHGFARRVDRSWGIRDVIGRQASKRAPRRGPVVCFRSAPATARGFHSLVPINDTECALPPFARIELERIDEPGKWRAPNGVVPQQRLYTVRVTFA